MLAPLIAKRSVTRDLFVLRLHAPEIAATVLPGQFVNVLPRIGAIDPLLRRPFSVYQHADDWIELIIQIHGRGTNELSHSIIGESLDVLGPLGSQWQYHSPGYETAILVIGGVGVASMPSITDALGNIGKPFQTYYGARSESLFADEYLRNVHYATDDGSRGVHGNIIETLRLDLAEAKYAKPKLFVCGPTPMMRAAVALADEFSIGCEVSLETEMACGVGICQGCPVQTSPSEFEKSGKKFHLVCTNGPSFECEQIIF